MAEQDTSPRSTKDSERNEKGAMTSRQNCCSTYDLLREVAARNPEQTAIALLTEGVPFDRPRCISYGALLSGIHQTANLLTDLGVEPGGVIALLLPDLLETHLLLWGGQVAGSVCPLPLGLPVEQMIALLRVAKAKILVAAGQEVSQALWQKAEEVRREVKSIAVVLQVGGPGKERDAIYAFDALLADYPSSRLDTRQKIAPNDIALSLPIRGTTETPNFAPLTHADLLDAAWAIGNVLTLAPEDVLLRGLLHFLQVGW